MRERKFVCSSQRERKEIYIYIIIIIIIIMFYNTLSTYPSRPLIRAPKVLLMSTKGPTNEEQRAARC